MSFHREDSPGYRSRESLYGSRIAAVEPGGVDAIPLSVRHGRPTQMFRTWISPNLQFATVFVGVLAVAAFGLSFWQATAVILLGNATGAAMHGVLAAQGPRFGLTQMVLGRVPFGYRGNVLPAGLNSLTSVGWFAVGSISAALALNTLTRLPKPGCLLIAVVVQVAVAFLGHNLIQAFERYAFPVLASVFTIATVVILSRATHLSDTSPRGATGGFLLTFATCWSYTAGWSPTASDYTRYLPVNVDHRKVVLWCGLGVFVPCSLLEIAGAASACAGSDALGDPTGSFTDQLPAPVAAATLLAIAVGAIAGGAMNVYSGAISVLTLGIRWGSGYRRALSALVFGITGSALAYVGLTAESERYQAFLLLIAYWVAPWLGVVLLDLYLRRGQSDSADSRVVRLAFDPGHRNWAGSISMGIGLVLSVWLFSNQELYVGLVPQRVPAVGDLTPEVGFTIATAIYALLGQRIAGDPSLAKMPQAPGTDHPN
ncbi:cytosine permease [Nocardia sp. ET3-3]|uniref:Cytosine permease n=1 Tax=Nocardia terrae TaxID=2675851 RepID=A0A7K1URY3_9NOCA|nr:cytosine permease [Nocardia terrae]MVU77112.1 cytosine permease [Nocardia terrae]